MVLEYALKQRHTLGQTAVVLSVAALSITSSIIITTNTTIPRVGSFASLAVTPAKVHVQVFDGVGYRTL